MASTKAFLVHLWHLKFVNLIVTNGIKIIIMQLCLKYYTEQLSVGNEMHLLLVQTIVMINMINRTILK